MRQQRGEPESGSNAGDRSQPARSAARGRRCRRARSRRRRLGRGGSGLRRHDRIGSRTGGGWRRDTLALRAEALAATQALCVGIAVRRQRGEQDRDNGKYERSIHRGSPETAVGLDEFWWPRWGPVTSVEINGHTRDAARRHPPRDCARRRGRSRRLPSSPSASPGPDASGSTRRDTGSSPRRRRRACRSSGSR